MAPCLSPSHTIYNYIAKTIYLLVWKYAIFAICDHYLFYSFLCKTFFRFLSLFSYPSSMVWKSFIDFFRHIWLNEFVIYFVNKILTHCTLCLWISIKHGTMNNKMLICLHEHIMKTVGIVVVAAAAFSATNLTNDNLPSNCFTTVLQNILMLVSFV